VTALARSCRLSGIAALRAATLALICHDPLGLPTTDLGRYARSVSPQRRAWLLLVAGSVLVLASVTVLLLVPTPAASFGWFAYAPLSDTVVTPGFVFLDPTCRWAVVVGVVGLIAASWAAGLLAGQLTK